MNASSSDAIRYRACSTKKSPWQYRAAIAILPSGKERAPDIDFDDQNRVLVRGHRSGYGFSVSSDMAHLWKLFQQNTKNYRMFQFLATDDVFSRAIQGNQALVLVPDQYQKWHQTILPAFDLLPKQVFDGMLQKIKWEPSAMVANADCEYPLPRQQPPPGYNFVLADAFAHYANTLQEANPDCDQETFYCDMVAFYLSQGSHLDHIVEHIPFTFRPVLLDALQWYSQLLLNDTSEDADWGSELMHLSAALKAVSMADPPSGTSYHG